VELARFAKSAPGEYGKPRRKIPGEKGAYIAGGGVLGSAAYLARQGQKAGKRGHPGKRFIFRQAGKTGAIGGGLVAAGVGIRELNKPKKPKQPEGVTYVAPGG